MSGKPSPSMVKLVLFAGLVTLVVTVVRLYGELQGWDPRFFGTGAGGTNTTTDAAGAESKLPGLFGIVFLIPIFGFWFGARLGRMGRRPRSVGKALGLLVLALAVFIGTFMLVMRVIKPDTKSIEGVRQMLLMSCAGAAIAALIALAAWPRLWGANFAYGLLARIPVVVITYLACQRGWNTHHVKLGPNSLELTDPMEKALWLSLPQLTIWPVGTVILGGIFGVIGAALFKPRAPR